MCDGRFIWEILYGAHMDVPRWVPDESLLQNPHRSHMGCPYRTHIITHLGPIWVPYSLLAGELLLRKLELYKCSTNFIKLMKSYLDNRSQAVSLGGKMSEQGVEYHRGLFWVRYYF